MWRHITKEAKFLDLNNLSLQRRPSALSNDGRKVWATVLFLSAIVHRKVIHVIFFVSFSLTYLQDHCLLISKNLATMVMWRNNLSFKKRDKREDWGRVRASKATGRSVRTSKDEWFYLIFYRYTRWKINGFLSGHKLDKRTALPSVTLAHYHGLRKQPTFREATTGLPVKWRLRNERRNSILMTRHFPDLGSASDWLEKIPFYTWNDQSKAQPRSR